MAFAPTGLSWVQNAYTLVVGGLVLLQPSTALHQPSGVRTEIV
jgi:hypothetical protein